MDEVFSAWSPARCVSHPQTFPTPKAPSQPAKYRFLKDFRTLWKSSAFSLFFSLSPFFVFCFTYYFIFFLPFFIFFFSMYVFVLHSFILPSFTSFLPFSFFPLLLFTSLSLFLLLPFFPSFSLSFLSIFFLAVCFYFLSDLFFLSFSFLSIPFIFSFFFPLVFPLVYLSSFFSAKFLSRFFHLGVSSFICFLVLPSFVHSSPLHPFLPPCFPSTHPSFSDHSFLFLSSCHLSSSYPPSSIPVPHLHSFLLIFPPAILPASLTSPPSPPRLQ